MASSPAAVGDAAAHAAVSMEAGAEQGSTLRRPGRLRVVHPDVAELLLGTRRRRTKKTAPERKEEEGECVRYDCAFEDEGSEGSRGFVPHRLVWGKVSNHPWWPAQVFDPADASELAQQHRKGRRAASATLIAYFWDKTFAWADAAALRPFRGYFPRLAGQSAVSSFAAAVDGALDEVARRVGAGLSCGCCAGGVARKQVIDNAGVREGACGAAVDATFTRHAFHGESFVEYISALAIAPMAGADRLDLTIAMAQLKAFIRWRGPRGLPKYTTSHGIEEFADAAATPASRAKSRRPRGGDDGHASAGKRRMTRRSRARPNAASEDVDDAFELEGLGPRSHSPSQEMSTKIGKLMSRAAQQMSRSPVIPRENANAPQAISCSTMARCTRVADECPSIKTGELKEDPLLGRLALNFSSPSTVPSSTDLVTIFSQFGAIKEAKVENKVAAVVFKRSVDADAAFSGTSKISALGASLISFRLTYLPSASMTDHPQSALDTEEKESPVY